MKIAAPLIFVLPLVACTSAPPQATPTTAPTYAPVVTPSQPATPPPTPAATPVPSQTAASGATPLEGIWATEPVTKDIMDAALTRAGLDPGQFHPWFQDWTGIDYRTFTVRINNGVWEEKDFSDGVHDGGFLARFKADGSTLTVHDSEVQCDVSFKLNRSGDVLNIELGDDTCGTDDVMVETAIYEATPFHLIQAADWQPPTWNPPPPPSPRPTHAPSSSGDRLVRHPAGSVGGAALGYLEYLPPGYSEGGAPKPLLLFLHGSGESGIGDLNGLDRLTSAGIPHLISNSTWPDSRPFVVLAPQHDEQPPSFCLEATEIHAFIAFALEHYNIDPSRLYATGLSCGAIGLWNYLTQYGGDTLAAVAPIAGNGILAYQVRGCELATLPIWAFHGALDTNVAVAGDVYPLTQLQACTNPAPVDARITVFPDSAHDVWSRTYVASDFYDIYDWFLSHSRP